MKLLQKILTLLDPTKVQVSRTHTHSTSLGKFLGLLIIIFLGLTFIFKLLSIIRKQTMYLNSFQASDRSPVDIRDFYMVLTLSDWGDAINYANQFQYGLNVTMQEVIWDRTGSGTGQSNGDQNRDHKQQSMGMNFQDIIYNRQQLLKIRNKFQYQHFSINEKQVFSDENFKDQKLFVRTFPMIPCKFRPNSFCPPEQFTHNLTLAGEYNLDDKLIISYYMIVKPCNKSVSDTCQEADPDGYNAFFSYKWKGFNVYEKDDQKIQDLKQLPVVRLSLIAADSFNKTQYQKYKVKQINLTTHSPTYFPSFLQSILESTVMPSSHQLKQFWFYDGEQSLQYRQRQSKNNDLYLSIQFARSMRSESYERRYVNVDNLLAEIFGISAFLALLAKILIGDYVRWSVDQEITRRVGGKEDKESETHGEGRHKGTLLKYLRQRVFECCHCCHCCRKRNKKLQQETTEDQEQKSLYQQQIKKKEQILKQANANVDIIQITKKLRNLEQKIAYILNPETNQMPKQQKLNQEKETKQLKSDFKQKQIQRQKKKKNQNKNYNLNYNQKQNQMNLKQQLSQNLINAQELEK